MTSLLLDQGVPRSVTSILRRQGWQVTHVGELAMSRSSDREILEYARRTHLAIVTLDADFHAMLAVEGHSGPSVIRVRQQGLHGTALAGRLLDIWPMIHEAVAAGAMVSLTDQTVRVRLLPLGRHGDTE